MIRSLRAFALVAVAASLAFLLPLPAAAGPFDFPGQRLQDPAPSAALIAAPAAREAVAALAWRSAGDSRDAHPAAASSSARVPLLDAVVARGDLLTLADFLAPAAPATLRARAAFVSLGASPLPGARRIVVRLEIERALRAQPDLRALIEVPGSVAVLRWSRPLSHEQILQAVAAALRENHLTGGASLTVADLDFPSQVSVTEDAPRLEVLRIQPALDGSGSRFRLTSPSEPRLQPFWVVVHRDIEQPTAIALRDLSPGAPIGDDDVRIEPRPAQVEYSEPAAALAAVVGRTPRRSIRAGEELRPAQLDPLVLVHPGQPVQLIAQSPGMRIMTMATPLDRGLAGQTIRVRNETTGKIVSAVVTGPQEAQIVP